MRWTVLVSLVALASGAPRPALAQGYERLEVSSGYSLLLDRKIGDFGLSGAIPLGWWVSVSANLSRRLALAAEAGGQYGRDTALVVRPIADFYFEALDEDVDVRAHALLIGPRLVSRREGVALFGQVLGGVARLAVVGESGETRWSYSEPALQPGAGVELRVSDRADVRFQVDYRAVVADETYSQVRFGVGVSFGFLAPR